MELDTINEKDSRGEMSGTVSRRRFNVGRCQNKLRTDEGFG
jgi:hypothetical protein